MYGITSIEVISDSDWDEGHLAGTNLCDLIIYSRSDVEIGLLNSVQDFGEVMEQHRIVFPKPALQTNHVFTIRINKSNGEVVEATTVMITWE